MDKKINNIISFIIVVTICLVTFSITYAWFTSVKETDIINPNSSGNIDIVYDKGQDIVGSLVPSSNKDKGLSTSVRMKQTENSVDSLATVSLKINTIDPELAISGLKWEIYMNENVSPLATGDFSGKVSEETINLVEDYNLTTTETTFKVYIWLNGNEIDNSVINKKFDAYIYATAKNKPAKVS